jgi:chloride channel 7
MAQMSNDVRILLPAMVAIMLAKWVADAASHSLYHGLLEVKCVPFLPKEPLSDVSLDLLEVRYVMAAPVATLHERMPLGELRDVLRGTRHNGFPVVRDAGGGLGPVFVGLLARDHLARLLLEAVRRGGAAGLEVPYGQLDGGGGGGGVGVGPGSSGAAAEAAQQLAVLEGRPPTAGHYPAEPALWEEVLDLTPYINMAAHRVPETFSVDRAYVLFSTMGLRHLVVVDEHNRVRGIVTRKDLLGFKLDGAVARARSGAAPGEPIAAAPSLLAPLSSQEMA